MVDKTHLRSPNPDPLPTCAVCQRPVDAIEVHYDIMRQATIYTVYCHGSKETVILGDRDVLDSASDGISFGVAFGTRRIGAPVVEIGGRAGQRALQGPLDANMSYARQGEEEANDRDN